LTIANINWQYFSFLTLLLHENMCLQSDKIWPLCSVAYTVNDTGEWFCSNSWLVFVNDNDFVSEKCKMYYLHAQVLPQYMTVWSLFKHQNMQVLVLLFSLSRCSGMMMFVLHFYSNSITCSSITNHNINIIFS